MVIHLKPNLDGLVRCKSCCHVQTLREWKAKNKLGIGDSCIKCNSWSFFYVERIEEQCFNCKRNKSDCVCGGIV